MLIDNKADQIITITTSNPEMRSYCWCCCNFIYKTGVVLVFHWNNETFNGYLKGVITGVTTDSGGASTIDVRVLSRVSDSYNN